MRIDFHRIDQPAEALFAPGADLISLPLAVSLLENRRQGALVKTWLDDQPLEYSLRADSFDLQADYGDGPVLLQSTPGPHFRRTLRGPETTLEIHPTEECEEVRGRVGTVAVALHAGPGEEISGELGGESFQASIHELPGGEMRVEGRLGTMPLRQQIVPTEQGYLVTGSLGPHRLRQEVSRT